MVTKIVPHQCGLLKKSIALFEKVEMVFELYRMDDISLYNVLSSVTVSFETRIDLIENDYKSYALS